MKYKKFVSAVAYVHNSEGEMERFLNTLYNVFNKNFESFEIILVDDSSTDNSKQVIREFANSVTNCMISVVNTGFYQGVEAAMLAGIDLAIGDFVYEFDEIEVDYDPDLIMLCHDRCIQGFDIVSCGIGRRRTSSRIFYSIYNRHSGTQYPLKSETFRIVSRRAINRVYSMSPNPIYRKALYRNCGLKTDYLEYNGISDNERKHSDRGNLKNPHDTALTSLLLFTNVAYKAAIVLTILMMLATFVSSIYVVIVFLTGIAAPGYTTMMILISGAFFGVFAILAVVIKYLSVLLKLAFQRQRYLLESIEKLTG